MSMIVKDIRQNRKIEPNYNQLEEGTFFYDQYKELCLKINDKSYYNFILEDFQETEIDEPFVSEYFDKELSTIEIIIK